MMTNKLIVEAEHVAATLSVVREQAKELEQHIADLEMRLRMARGTGDLTQRARKATEEGMSQKPRDLKEMIVGALKRESLTLSQLARSLGSAPGPVAEAMKDLRKEGFVYNVGSAEYPIWTARIGDQTPTPELAAQIRRLISERPMTTKELVQATDARMSRVSGCMIQFQRTEKGLIDMGNNPRRARWFLVSERAQSAKLEPKPPVTGPA